MEETAGSIDTDGWAYYSIKYEFDNEAMCMLCDGEDCHIEMKGNFYAFN